MSKINDGGPAFPCEGGDLSGLHAAPGMSLRDWFAGQALMGMVGAVDHGVTHYQSDSAALAYRYADAMLATRDQP